MGAAAALFDVDHGLSKAAQRPYMCSSEAFAQVPHAGLEAAWFQSCQTTVAHVPVWGGFPCRGGMHGLREVH